MWTFLEPHSNHFKNLVLMSTSERECCFHTRNYLHFKGAMITLKILEMTLKFCDC